MKIERIGAICRAATTVLAMATGAAGIARAADVALEAKKVERYRCTLEVPAGWAQSEDEDSVTWTLGDAAITLAAWDERKGAKELEKAHREDAAKQGGKVFTTSNALKVKDCPTLRLSYELPGETKSDPMVVTILYVLEPWATYLITHADLKSKFDRKLVERVAATLESDARRRGRPASKEWEARRNEALGFEIETPAKRGELHDAERESVVLTAYEGDDVVTVAWVPGFEAARAEASIKAAAEKKNMKIVDGPKNAPIGGLEAVRVVYEDAKKKLAMAFAFMPGGAWQIVYSDAKAKWSAKTWERMLGSFKSTRSAK